MCKSRAHLHEHVEADVFETHVHKLIREVPPNLLKEIFLLLLIIITRPKPAYGRQGLDWIVGPGYSFVVFSTNETMETHQKP